MKAYDLSIALNYIDIALLEETEANRKKIVVNKRKIGIIPAIAACLAVVLTVGIFGILIKNKLATTKNLPTIPLSVRFEGMGYEGLFAYSIDELVDNNPWNKSLKIKTLPVFENKFAYDDNGNYSKIGAEDFVKMYNKLYKISDALGIKREELDISDNSLSAEAMEEIKNKISENGKKVTNISFNAPSQLYGKFGNFKITVYEFCEATIEIEPGISLPKGYKGGLNSSYKDVEKTAEYLFKKYKSYLNFKKPVINISEGDYTVNLEQLHNISFYDAGGSIEERIINFNFNRVDFYVNEDNKLWLIRLYSNESLEKSGDYPIITAKAAEKLLREGKFVTSVPYEIKKNAKIEKVELVYRNVTWERHLMPFYRFYIKIPMTEVMEETGINHYGLYYVPAVKEEYLSGFNIWDGSIN